MWLWWRRRHSDVADIRRVLVLRVLVARAPAARPRAVPPHPLLEEGCPYVSEIAGVALLPEGMRAWALEALKGKEGAAYPIVMYNAVNKVPKYDHKGLHFKRNYPIDCKTCQTGKKEGKPARLSDDGPPKKKGKQSQLSFAKPSSK